ncbi:type IV secretion system protein [Brachymonas sp.]|uniref:type IV secretion system protein n=2 Tax=unclassified Brachymonas TaxID=2621329 RepID=UPI0035B3EC24
MVQDFGYAGMGRLFQVTITIGTACLTLWFMWEGWRMVSGQSRESFMGFLNRAFVVIIVVASAQGFALSGHSMMQTVRDMQNIVAQAITGNEYTSPDKMVGKVLTYMLTLQSILQIYQGSVSPGGADFSNTLTFITGAGQAVPALLAGGLSLLNEVALNLSFVFGPLFILCYISVRTRFLFVNWVKFTVTTLFSMAVLSVVTVIALKAIIMMAAMLIGMNVSSAVAGAAASALGSDSLLGSLLEAGSTSPSLTDIATVTGGVGMLLTTLILGVPPLVVSFFSNGMGAVASGYNQVGTIAAQASGGGMRGPVSGPQDLMQRQQQGTGGWNYGAHTQPLSATDSHPGAKRSDSLFRILPSGTSASMGSEPGIRITSQSKLGLNTAMTDAAHATNGTTDRNPSQSAMTASSHSTVPPSSLASWNAPASEARNMPASEDFQTARTDTPTPFESSAQQSSGLPAQENSVTPTALHGSASSSSTADARPHPYSIGLNSPFRQP